MSPSPLLGGFVGALIMSGVLLIALGARPRAVPLVPYTSPDSGARKVPFVVNIRALATTSIVGVAIASVTGWWSITLLACMGGVLLPAMYAERQSQIADRRRVSAVASWVETVRDLLSAASGIDEAIIRSSQTLPRSSPIKQEVETLAATASLGGLRNGRSASAQRWPTQRSTTSRRPC